MIRTFHNSNFLPKHDLLAVKKQKGISVSVVIPALNEAATIGSIVACIQNNFVEQTPLVDEIIVIDGASKDQTQEEARKAGALVYTIDEAGPSVVQTGKGVALWKSQFVTKGDILLFIDSDILDFNERFVYGLLGPLLLYDEIDFVKAFYKRPLAVGDGVFENNGGRVTEILVRPFLCAFIPQLAYLCQPLAGEYAIRRKLMETLPCWSGYGVEIGLLLDIYFSHGISGIAQVDMESRHHRNRSVSELSKMAFGILQVMLSRLEKQELIACKQVFKEMISANGLVFEGTVCDETELPSKDQLYQEVN
jgi:glucosyl-3-phosphoglycerate synthase